MSNYTCNTAYTIPDCGQYWSHGPDQGNGANYADATHAVWYTYTLHYSGTIDIYSCYGFTDTRLNIYTGSCSGLTLIASSDDACPVTTGGSPYASELLNIPVTQGVSILIEWDDRWSQNGFWFSMDFTAGGFCNEIVNLTSAGSYSIDRIPCTGFAAHPPAENSIWYRFTPPSTGMIDIYSCNQNVNTNLWVYSGVCSALSMIASSDDDCNAGGNLGQVASMVTGLNVTINEDIWLEWDDRWSTEGFDFTISYQGNCPPSFNLTGIQSVDSDFETDGTITSTQTISGAGTMVDYDSGTDINLNLSFEVLLGAEFHAFIDGCGGLIRPHNDK